MNISGWVPDAVIDRLWERGSTFNDMEKVVKEILLEGYAIDQLLNQLVEKVVTHKGFTEVHKAKICNQIAAADKSLGTV